MINVYVAFPFRLLGLFLIFLLLVSSTRLGSDAQSKLESCSDTKIQAVSASGSDTNFPASSVLDLNRQTLWSTYGKGSWIQVDLGKVKNLCSLDIEWYKGDQRQNNFIISVSRDGSSYVNVFDSTSSGKTSLFERYDLQNIAARYVKITVNGNTQNQYASIVDLKVNSLGLENANSTNQISANSLSDKCAKVTISKVIANGAQSTNPPSNVIDNNMATRWSNQGLGSWIQLDLGSQKTICSVDIRLV